eukprot:gene19755-biopygen16404
MVIDANNAGSQSHTISLLGLQWNTLTDNIMFREKNFDSDTSSLTKRKVLSISSQLLDPFGLVLPVTILARLFIAELWDEQLGWDQPLPSTKANAWKKVEQELTAASRLQFSRFLNFDSTLPVHLHVFTDASKLVMGAVSDLSQGTECVLLGSKSKLAPRGKTSLTIPQLELSAMLLGAQLCSATRNILQKDYGTVKVHLWTDSEIALYWLSSRHKLKQFVQSKVDTINKLFDSTFWSHTPSQENPANLVSRGCSSNTLQTSSLWSNGPSWIPIDSLWPRWPKTQPTACTVATAVGEHEVTSFPNSICHLMYLDRFNHYPRLLSSSVYVHRFCYRTGLKGPPTTSELEFLEKEWLRKEQQLHYPQVYDYLASHSRRSASHIPPIIRQLHLFLDNDGLIRTKGRFHVDSSLILLSRSSRLTKLIVQDHNHRNHHIGVGGTLVALRQRCWIPSARSITRQLLRTCITCRKVTGKPYLLPTSAAPSFHLDTANRPFSNVGIDFTGHLLVKDRSGHPQKVYICLLTCRTTIAISLELVEDLTTASFLQAFRRHCSIFSTPRLVLSDNAQTFKRSEQNLHALLSLIDDETIQRTFAQQRIVFRYIPARSPHWGGVYERLIGLTKTCLKKVLGRSFVTLSELQTLLKEIQAVLNDRPLTYINDNLQDLQPITPSQLLFGYNVTALPQPSNDVISQSQDSKFCRS